LRGTAQLLVSLLVLMVLAAAVRRQAIVISSTAPERLPRGRRGR